MYPGLPKTMVEALERLASEAQIDVIRHDVYSIIETMSQDPDQDDMFGDVCTAPTFMDEWGDGLSDQTKTMSIDEIRIALGLPSAHLPMFNERYDPTGLHNPHDDQEWFRDHAAETEPLEVRWHQWVGVKEMVERCFNGESNLLADAVALGKTLQVYGVMAMLAYMHDYWEKNHDFPGQFSK